MGEKKAIREALMESDRLAKDKMFKNGPDSPLREEDRSGFEGLKYFSYNPRFRVYARIERDEEQATLPLTMSNHSTGNFIRYGTITFSVEATVVSLVIFRDQNLPEMSDSPGQLFIPFTDKTTGEETCPFGRYLLLKKPTDETKITLDFNQAINPYSAYNPNYKCVKPPPENFIPVPILAGEQVFKDNK